MKLNLLNEIDGSILHDKENNNAYTDTGINSKISQNGLTSRLPEKIPAAMAYVPYQQWGEVFDSSDALEKGTIFPELVFPFEKGGRT